MNRQKLAVAAFSLVLIIATVLGCGTPGQNFLIPSGGGAQFAFVVDSVPESNVSGLDISAYSLDSTTGKLTPVPNSPFTVTAVSGTGNMFIDVDPSGHFLFAPNRDADSVSVFSIGSNGALTAVVAPAPTNGSDAFAVKVHPSGKYLYVGHRGSDDITAFSISSTGTLTLIGEGPESADGEVHHLFMDPKGRFLYAGIWNAAIGAPAGAAKAVSPRSPTAFVIDAFAISSTDGSLTYVGAVLAGNRPQSGTVDSTGKFLLVTNYGDDDVGVYQIDQNTGALTEIEGSAFPTGYNPFQVAEFSAGGVTYMAVSNTDDGTVSVFKFDQTTGALTSNGAPADLAAFPIGLAVDKTGKFGYVTDASNDNIVGVTLNATGDAVPIPGSPFSGGGISSPAQIVIAEQE